MNEREYNIVRRKIFGKVIFERNRKITGKFDSKSNYEINESLPISLLMLSRFPYLLVDGYERYQENKWQSFAIDFISFSIIEAYLNKQIVILEYHENLKVSFNLYNETNVNLVIVIGSKDFDTSQWIDCEIGRLCLLDQKGQNPGSNINGQISRLVSDMVGFCEYPFKQFSKTLILKINRRDKFYKLAEFENERILFSAENEIRLEFESPILKRLECELKERIQLINRRLAEDKFLARLFLILNKSLEHEIGSFEISEDPGD